MANAITALQYVKINGEAVPLLPITDYGAMLNAPDLSSLAGVTGTVYADVGNATAMEITMTGISSYDDLNSRVIFIKKNVGMGDYTTLVLKINGLAAKPVYRGDGNGTALNVQFSKNAIAAGQLIAVFYDGTKFVMLGDSAPNAATAVKLKTARTINGVAFSGESDIILPTNMACGVCSTAAATAAKTVAASGFTLSDGAMVTVRFSNTNTNSSPTLNINGTGAKSIFAYGAQVGSSSPWLASGKTITFVYNNGGNRFDILLPDKASSTEATTGVIDTAFMTPLGTSNAITAKIASENQAKAGTDNATLMSPLRTKQAITEFTPTKATSSIAKAGTDDSDYMTALRTKEAITTFAPSLVDSSRCATIVVAAANSSQKSKNGADFVCTGTNDQTTLVAAVNALPNSYCGKIVLTEGTFNLSATWEIGVPDISVEGSGSATVLKRIGNFTGHVVNRTYNMYARGTSFKDFAIDGGETDPPSGNSGLYVVDGKDCLVEGVRVTGCDSGIYLSTSGAVFGCYCTNCGTGINAYSRVRIVGNYCLENGTGIKADGYCIVSSNVVANSTVTGIFINGHTGKACDNQLYNNASGIVCGGPRCVISGNGIHRTSAYSGVGYSIHSYGEYCIITDNICQGKAETVSGTGAIKSNNIVPDFSTV